MEEISKHILIFFLALLGLYALKIIYLKLNSVEDKDGN